MWMYEYLQTVTYSLEDLGLPAPHMSGILEKPAFVSALRRVVHRLPHRNSGCARGVGRDTWAGSYMADGRGSGQVERKGGCWEDSKAAHSDSWPLSAQRRNGAVATEVRKSAQDASKTSLRIFDGPKTGYQVQFDSPSGSAAMVVVVGWAALAHR